MQEVGIDWTNLVQTSSCDGQEIKQIVLPKSMIKEHVTIHGIYANSGHPGKDNTL